MKNLIFRPIVLTLLFLLAVVSSVCAQTRQGNRWLIVTDTSLPMERRSVATQDAVEKMLLTGMSGQLRSGDTIGMWTFNDELHSGDFPLQLWRPETFQTIAARAGQFVKVQTYEKTARFDQVIPAIKSLVTNSVVITVILITDGSEKIEGTPYDDNINKALKQDYSYQKKMNQPFVITFLGVGGRFSGYTVNPAPWPVSFVPLPPEPEALVEKNFVEPKPEINPQPVKEPSPVVPSLILTGKKPEPAPPVQSAADTDEKPSVTVNSEPAEQPVVPTIKEPAITVSVPENPPVTISSPPAPAVAEVKPTPAPPIEPKPQSEAAISPTPPEVITPAPATMTEAVTPAAAPPPVTTVQPAADKTTATEAAIVTPAGADGGKRTTLLFGVGLLVVALGVGMFWLRRPRHMGQGSLITRSLDKDKK